ncbi:MAG: CRISPR-associated protein Csm4 [Mitsuokella multacida]|jgi:CRISPR-associated protein Csm4
MSYYLFTLQFDAPVHFGKAEQGGGLEHTSFALPADALFSAVLAELSQAGEYDVLQELLPKVQQGKLRFSDLLPWQEEQDGTWSFYLPRPVIAVKAAEQKAVSYQKTCEMATARKRQKKLCYIRASRFHEYFKACANGTPFAENNDFGQEILRERVNCRGEEPLPYFVGAFAFHENAGLYLLLEATEEEDAEQMAALLEFIGHTGLGGKRSSGYGKFHLADDMVMLEDDAIYGEDDAALYQLLHDDKAAWQMMVSPVLPGQKDMDIVSQGAYRLRHVGGFVTTAALAEKKNSICLLDSGSCLQKRVAGSMAELGKNEGHSVYRYGYGLYVGVPDLDVNNEVKK